VLLVVTCLSLPLPWARQTEGCRESPAVRERTGHALLVADEDAEDRVLALGLPLVLWLVAFRTVHRQRAPLVRAALHALGTVFAGASAFMLLFMATFTLFGSSELLPAAWVGIGACAGVAIDGAVRAGIDLHTWRRLRRLRRARGP
jgi:hypothetical protein